jgi:PPM family protein phosphatase
MSLVTPREPSMSSRLDDARHNEPIVARQTVFASRSSELELAAASDCSRRHRVNEDSHSVLDGPSPVYVVADGVGGGAMASWTSRELVQRLHASLDQRRIDVASIRAALLDADHELARGIARETAGSGAATVALCAGIGPSLAEWLIAWVGDCRIYRLRTTVSDPAELLTRDDTYDHLGEQPPPGASPNDPARMVGNGAVAAPNIEKISLRDGEMLVLCSDGLHKHVDANELSGVLRTHVPLSRACERLLELVRSRGGIDDATLLVVHRKARRHGRFGWMTMR